ncbi:MAG: cell division protein FtsZ, partial [Candidatus Micrarchaeota archaeon]|nr:cell division protein FtsZ [Candidatus Micrarchaeota archaeon]
PLLDATYEGAKGALLHINGGSGLTLGEGIEIGERVSSNFDLNADVKIGARLDPSMGDTISVTSIVTGVQSPYNIAKAEKPREVAKMEMGTLSYL